ncbi:MAG: Sec-independent protein translocase protein TatB [Alphaproteobacteria bacterium MarineAlpha10_Bin1]|jgi:sec-independent protein translocase protein TatB|nr:MAG: Sec-independent protein translocase protein TatB [Alphaproteobacteria bacterium MarineAlpha10_Bin1]
MLDIGWMEIAIVMGIAIVVVGPKELPKVLRTVGKWRGKASAYARDFQRSIEDAADYSEMDAIKKEIEEANRELNDAKRDLGDQAASVKSDMEAATKDKTVLKVDSDGGVSEPSDGSSDGGTAKPGDGQENSANA